MKGIGVIVACLRLKFEKGQAVSSKFEESKAKNKIKSDHQSVFKIFILIMPKNEKSFNFQVRKRTISNLVSSFKEILFSVLNSSKANVLFAFLDTEFSFSAFYFIKFSHFEACLLLCP